MKFHAVAFGLTAILLSACGSGVQTPQDLRATWGADCSSPFVKIGESSIHVYPDNADYDLKAATFANNKLTLSYDTNEGSISEVYVLADDMLRLDHGIYGGSQVTWHKQPMKKCSIT